MTTKSPAPLVELERYARSRLHASRHPQDIHRFRPAPCPQCGVVPLILSVDHHTGSRRTNFRGKISGVCSKCGQTVQVLSFTGQHRQHLRTEHPRCRCGNTSFLVAELERFESDRGLPGFFDEGVVVGKCSRCGRQQALVFTD